MSGQVADLGFAVDLGGINDAAARLDYMGQSAQRAGGHMLVVGNSFRAFAADMTGTDMGAAKFTQLGDQAARAQQQLDLMSGASVTAANNVTTGFAKAADSAKAFGSALEVIPQTLGTIESALDRSFVSIGKSIDTVARGITDLRTIRSVFERDLDQPAQTSGQHLAEMGKHMLELKAATTGFSAAGLDSAASMVTVAARANIAIGTIATLGATLYEAAKASRSFEEQQKALDASLALTNSASGLTANSAQSLIDRANRQTGFDQQQLAATMQELVKARTVGAVDSANIFTAGTTWADRSGQDPTATIRTLIAAYNDLGGAAKGLEAIGINLDASERKQLDTFNEAGEKAKGFGVILAEVAARNAEYADKIDDSTASSRRFSAESDELLRNIGDGWRALLSVFEIDITKYLVDPIRDALSQIINMINSTVHATSANLETRLDLAKKGLSAAEGLASGGGVQEGVDLSQDVINRRQEVERLTVALKAAKDAEQSLAAQQGETRQKAVEKYEKNKADTAAAGSATEDAINAILRQTEALQHQAEAWKLGDEAAQKAAQKAAIADQAHDQFVAGATKDEQAYADALTARAAAQAEAAGAKSLYGVQQENADLVEMLGKVKSAEMSLGDYEDELDNKRHERALKAQGLSDETIAKLMDEYETTKDLTDQYDAMAKAQEEQQKTWESIGKTIGDAFTRPIEAAVKLIAEGKSTTIEWGKTFKAIFASLELDLIKMATVNPLMNALGLGGTHSPSLWSALSTVGGYSEGNGGDGVIVLVPEAA